MVVNALRICVRWLLFVLIFPSIGTTWIFIDIETWPLAVVMAVFTVGLFKGWRGLSPASNVVTSDIGDDGGTSPHPAAIESATLGPTQGGDINVASLFELLDGWRHLPSYQLERRVDAMFGLFLPYVLDHALGIKIDHQIIPEFPLGQDHSNHSYKADFFAVSKNKERAFLVELKTDRRSLDKEQEDYLERAVERGLAALLCDVRSMAKAKKAHVRKKYFHLLEAVAALDLITLPSELENKIYSCPRGVYVDIDSIEICSTLPKLDVIYVLPTKPVNDMGCLVIDFENFASVVRNHSEMGSLFAKYLKRWAEIEAGEAVSKN